MTPAPHLASVATRIDRSHGIARTFHRAKCTCGWRGTERANENVAAAEAGAHAGAVGAEATA